MTFSSMSQPQRFLNRVPAGLPDPEEDTDPTQLDKIKYFGKCKESSSVQLGDIFAIECIFFVVQNASDLAGKINFNFFERLARQIS